MTPPQRREKGRGPYRECRLAHNAFSYTIFKCIRAHLVGHLGPHVLQVHPAVGGRRLQGLRYRRRLFRESVKLDALLPPRALRRPVLHPTVLVQKPPVMRQLQVQVPVGVLRNYRHGPASARARVGRQCPRNGVTLGVEGQRPRGRARRSGLDVLRFYEAVVVLRDVPMGLQRDEIGQLGPGQRLRTLRGNLWLLSRGDAGVGLQ